METVSQPEVFLKGKPSGKPLLFTVLGVLILGGMIFLAVYYHSQIQTKLGALLTSFNTKTPIVPKLISQGKGSDLVKNNFTIFYTDLEYDPKTGTITQLSADATNENPLQLLSSPPPASDNKFIYKVEVLSSTNKIIQSGWVTQNIATTQPKNSKIQFRVTVNYQSKALIKVSLLSGKLIWVGRIS